MNKSCKFYLLHSAYLSVDVIVVLWQSIAVSVESRVLTIHGDRAGRAG